MPSDAITAATRPPFPTYLLPSFSSPLASSHLLPFRRRHSSTTSATSSLFSAPSLSTSPISPTWSPNTTPSSSPPGLGYFNWRPRSSTSTVPEQPAHHEHEADAAADLDVGRRLARTHSDTLKCSGCATDIAFASQIVSKGFTGRHGRAYLVSAPQVTVARARRPEELEGREKEKGKEETRTGDLVNTKVGRPVSRQLVTGAHVVADISCLVCGQVVGWKYVDAKEVAQRYKIGKFILETRRVVGGKGWEDVDGNWERRGGLMGEGKDGGEENEEEVVFDSEDEDECEDLFTGVWDAEVVKKRRARRVGLKGKDEVQS